VDEFLVPVKAASVLDILEASHVRSSMRSAPTLAALRACAFLFFACPCIGVGSARCASSSSRPHTLAA